MISAYTLFSSSSGNCTYVTDGDVSILIDAGMNATHVGLALGAKRQLIQRLEQREKSEKQKRPLPRLHSRAASHSAIYAAKRTTASRICPRSRPGKNRR